MRPLHQNTKQMIELMAPFRAAGIPLIKRQIGDSIDYRITIGCQPDPKNPMPVDECGFLDLSSYGDNEPEWVAPTHASVYFTSAVVLPAIIQNEQLEKGDCSGYRLGSQGRHILSILHGLRDTFGRASQRGNVLAIPQTRPDGDIVPLRGYRINEEQTEIVPVVDFILKRSDATLDARYTLENIVHMSRAPA